MATSSSLKKSLFFAIGMLFVFYPVAQATGVWVYSFNFSDKSYVAVSPYVQWSPSAVQSSASQKTWVPADQFLAIQTDMPYQQGQFWGIQVFTDNTEVGNAAPGAPAYNVPDYFIGSTFVQGGTTNGPLSPVYKGNQSTFDKTTSENKVPVSGLVSSDGLTRIPLIWRLFDNLPFPASTVPAIQENPNAPSAGCASNVTCDFCDCSWFYWLDKGDKKLSSIAGQPPVSDWQANYWYDRPMSHDGSYYTVCSPADQAAGRCSGPFKPTTSNGFTTQYLVVAANFASGTAQKYQTTLFVELFIP